MINILVYSSLPPDMLNTVFEYSKIFSLSFRVVSSDKDILKYFMRDEPSLFIVDFSGSIQKTLPFLRTLKKLSPVTPIIAIGNEPEEKTVLAALKNGAVSFIDLPCSGKEFYYRLNAVMNLLHTYQSRDDRYIMLLGDLKIYLKNNQVMLGSEFIPLTNIEYKILIMLADNFNELVSTEEMYEHLWSMSELKSTSRTLHVHISNLRHKLKLDQHTALSIATIHGKGYSLRLNMPSGRIEVSDDK